MKPKPKRLKYQKVYKVTKLSIRGFFEDHRFLSNYHLCSIWYEGKEYPSTENAYQAAKFPDMMRTQFQNISPKDAKSLGNVLKMNSEQIVKWDAKKIDVMSRISMYKYSEHPELRSLLLNTEEKYLEETNYWQDVYWGVYKSKGYNHLGNTLMDIRSFWQKVETRKG